MNLVGGGGVSYVLPNAFRGAFPHVIDGIFMKRGLLGHFGRIGLWPLNGIWLP